MESNKIFYRNQTTVSNSNSPKYTKIQTQNHLTQEAMQPLTYGVSTSFELQRKSKKIQKTLKRRLKRKSPKTIMLRSPNEENSVEKDLVLNKKVRNMEQYRLISQLALSNSKIQKAIDVETQAIVIIKEHYSLEAYECEVRALCQLDDHPNVIKLFNVIEWDQITTENEIIKNVALALEYAPRGDLASYWKHKKPFSEHASRAIFKQLVAGLHYIHDRDIAHMDLKLENLFITENLMIKIGDFDHAICHSAQSIKADHGTPGYLAPEMFKHSKHYGKPTDIFALGIILFMLCTGRRPMQISNGMDDIFYRCIKDNNMNFFLNTVSRILNIEFTSQLKLLLEAMLKWEPNHRPLISQLTEFEWMKGCVNNANNDDKEDYDVYCHEMKSRM